MNTSLTFSTNGAFCETTEKGVVKWITFEDLKHGAFSEYNTMLEEHLKFINIL